MPGGTANGRRLSWRRFADVIAALSVGYGASVAIWSKSHPQALDAPAAQPYAVAWLINLPLFVFGIIWLIVRGSRFLPKGLEAFATKHPFVSRLGGVLIFLVIGVAAVKIARLL